MRTRDDPVSAEIHHLRLLRDTDQLPAWPRWRGASIGPVARERMDAVHPRTCRPTGCDEVLGAWKPYHEVIHNSLERTCRRRASTSAREAVAVSTRQVPTWGPHPDVPAGSSKIGEKIPLVSCPTRWTSQIHVECRDARRAVPRRLHGPAGAGLQAALAAFEYMLDQLGCDPEDICMSRRASATT